MLLSSHAIGGKWQLTSLIAYSSVCHILYTAHPAK